MRPIWIFLCVTCFFNATHSVNVFLDPTKSLFSKKDQLSRMPHQTALDRLAAGKPLNDQNVEAFLKRFTEQYFKSKNAIEETVHSLGNPVKALEDQINYLEQLRCEFQVIQGEIIPSLVANAQKVLKELNEGGIAHVIPFNFDPRNFLKAEPNADQVLMDINCELDGKPTNIQIFMRCKDLKVAGDWVFHKALHANDPFARAVMYASFKNGFFGTKGMESLAQFYKEGIHEPTVVAMENKFSPEKQK